jgi:hypothetical protein
VGGAGPDACGPAGVHRYGLGRALLKSEISLSEARRIALTAQGFNAPRRHDAIDSTHLGRAIERLGRLQIDSVNVLAPAHYLPIFSRLGPYGRGALEGGRDIVKWDMIHDITVATRAHRSRYEQMFGDIRLPKARLGSTRAMAEFYRVNGLSR